MMYAKVMNVVSRVYAIAFLRTKRYTVHFKKFRRYTVYIFVYRPLNSWPCRTIGQWTSLSIVAQQFSNRHLKNINFLVKYFKNANALHSHVFNISEGNLSISLSAALRVCTSLSKNVQYNVDPIATLFTFLARILIFLNDFIAKNSWKWSRGGLVFFFEFCYILFILR